jgi:predicted component of type VI protein secretion system
MAPATLEASFGKTGARGSLLRRSGKSRYWDQYRQFYEDLARRADERFSEVFEDTYRRIYQAERDRRAFREEREEKPAPTLPVAD